MNPAFKIQVSGAGLVGEEGISWHAVRIEFANKHENDDGQDGTEHNNPILKINDVASSGVYGIHCALPSSGAGGLAEQITVVDSKHAASRVVANNAMIEASEGRIERARAPGEDSVGVVPETHR